MATAKIEYTILLSSPSDVVEERRAAMEILKEVESSWGNPNGATLRILSWENDVPPNFGLEPQDVINQKLGNKWDIYLGIMHARFGNPTKKYGSGTEEEFNLAYKLWEDAPKDRVLMFYFKNAPVELDQIEPEQITKVKLFKKKVSSLGGLYKEFSSVENFKDLWRAHLTSILIDLHKQQSATIGIPNMIESQLTDQAQTSNAQSGMLDYIEIFMAGSVELVSVIAAFGTLVEKSAAHVRNETALLQQAVALGDIKGLRHVMTSLSKDMLNLANGLGVKRREYSLVSRKSFEALSNAIGFLKVASPQNNITNQQIILGCKNLINKIQQFISSIHGADIALNGQPNIAKEFNSAKLVLKQELSTLRSELNASIGLLKDLVAIAENNIVTDLTHPSR